MSMTKIHQFYEKSAVHRYNIDIISLHIRSVISNPNKTLTKNISIIKALKNMQ